MALIKKASIDEVVAVADFVEIVSGRTDLRKRGSRWTGLCPFHNEDTPSFDVNPIEKLFYCHGCHKGGDLITFVKETEAFDFAQAVEWLADRYRIELEYEETAPGFEARRSRRERLLSLLDSAARFYERHLWDTDGGEPVRAYLAERGLSEETCRGFRLGLSPGGDKLAAKARGKEYAQEELVAAGLVNRAGNDYFAGRLIFPLADGRGRVLGFGARRLAEDDPIPAKYVNSPEGELFKKSSIVYGLDHARATIAKQDRAVVVEGYTDVLALHQRGLEAAVASMGTALTEAQLRELRRLTRRLYLCFDADAAGAEATLRGMELANREFEEVWVVPLQPGTDPADAADDFEQRLEDATEYLVHRVRLEIDRAPSPQGAFEAVQALILKAPRGPDQEQAAKYAADRLHVPLRIDATSAPLFGEGRRKLMDAGRRLERDLLAICAVRPELAERYLHDLDDRHFDDPVHQRLRAYLAGEREADEELIALRAELDATAEREGLNEEAAKQLFLRLEERLVRRELSELGRDEVTTADLERTKELQGVLARIQEALQEVAFS
ncbi:MAG TPA: DNA primase [Gaiellaceae bacterium]